MFPAFLLAKMYVKGSLKNTDQGFEFDLKNIVDSALLIGVGPVQVGDQAYEPTCLTLTVADQVYPGADISPENPVRVRIGEAMRLTVQGRPLAPGAQRVTIAATIADLGPIKFDINDSVPA